MMDLFRIGDTGVAVITKANCRLKARKLTARRKTTLRAFENSFLLKNG